MTYDFVFCPRCGAPLTDGIKFGRPRRFCRYCGFIHFRDPKVAVIALVEHDDRVLLVRRAVIPRIGYWSLPGGYMDADERPEEAVVREVREETGVDVRVQGLHALHPMLGHADRSAGNAETPTGIVLVYRAEWMAGEPTPSDDVSEARWFAADELPWDTLAFETTDRFLRAWAAIH